MVTIEHVDALSSAYVKVNDSLYQVEKQILEDGKAGLPLFIPGDEHLNDQAARFAAIQSISRLRTDSSLVKSGVMCASKDTVALIEQLNLAKSAVSKRLGDLENKLGSKLINRTTRKSSLTEAGLLYYQRVKLILEDVDELDNQILTNIQTLEGSLKIAAPLSFGLTHLSPAIDAFVKEHSNLKIQVDF